MLLRIGAWFLLIMCSPLQFQPNYVVVTDSFICRSLQTYVEDQKLILPCPHLRQIVLDHLSRFTSSVCYLKPRHAFFVIGEGSLPNHLPPMAENDNAQLILQIPTFPAPDSSIKRSLHKREDVPPCAFFRTGGVSHSKP